MSEKESSQEEIMLEAILKIKTRNEKNNEIFINRFRDLLNDIKKDTNATIEEIVDGIGLGRVTVINFINNTSTHQQPIGRSNIITLWRTLTDENIYKLRVRGKKKLQAEHLAARAALKEDGLNKMLAAMGFQTDEQSIDTGDLSVSSIRKAHAIISRLSSEIVPNELVWKIEDSISEHISNYINIHRINNNDQNNQFTSDSPEDSLNRMVEILKSREKKENEKEGKIDPINEKRFRNAIKRCKKLGKHNFDESEITELFYSIKQKTIERFNVDKEFTIHVLNCEIKALDFYNQILNELSESNKAIKTIVSTINQLGQKAKYELGLEKEQDVNEEISEATMKEVQLNCTYFDLDKNHVDGDSRKFSWVYRSKYTNIKNILNAITRGIGINASLVNIKIKTLSSGQDSLIKVDCIVKFNNECEVYRGVWVDMDILTCIAQSFICAAEQWIKKHHIEANIESMYHQIYIIYNDICKARNALHNYTTNLSSQRIKANGSKPDLSFQKIKPKVLESDDIDTLEIIIKRIRDKSEEIKEQISSHDKIHPINFPYLFEFIEYAIQYSDLLDIRVLHINGDIRNAKIKLDGFNENHIKSREASPTIDLMYKTEEILNKSFRGEIEMIDRHLWRKKYHTNLPITSMFNLNPIKEYINKQNEDKLVLHTTSLYYSLSEFYGNLARLEFYFSQPSEMEEFEESVDSFLIAAYFSLQNDNGIRFSYWLCHAARSYTRLGNLDQANEILKMSEHIIQKSFKATDNSRYQKAIMSICYLAKSEYILFDYYKSKVQDKLNNLKDSIDIFAGAMFGFYIIGFERLMYDAIYNMYRLLTVLEEELSLENKKSTIKKICEVFESELNHIKSDQSKLNSDSNQNETEDSFVRFTEKFINILKSEYSKDTENTESEFISDKFKQASKMSKERVEEKWVFWFDSESNLTNRNHPIYDLVVSNKFLGEFL